MKPSTFRAVLCLFLVSLQLGKAANRYGCLFEKRLCSRNEVCIQDGLFGHCQDASSRNRIQYHISAEVLQRLREVLKQLMLQGLSDLIGIQRRRHRTSRRTGPSKEVDHEHNAAT